MLFFGKTKNRKLVLTNIKAFNNFIASLKESTVELRIRKWRKKRTLDQNALYWLWLQIIGENLGYDCEELHSTFKAMFLIDRSKKLPLVRSTTILNIVEFGQYLDKIERQAGELGILLPHPEDIKNRKKIKIYRSYTSY